VAVTGDDAAGRVEEPAPDLLAVLRAHLRHADPPCPSKLNKRSFLYGIGTKGST
jgi:hypothetical protein